MALATQCPHCYTSFRVANDQLKLHAGMVRCGSCKLTFNGIEHLLAPGEAPRKRPDSSVTESISEPHTPAVEETKTPPSAVQTAAQQQSSLDIQQTESDTKELSPDPDITPQEASQESEKHAPKITTEFTTEFEVDSAIVDTGAQGDYFDGADSINQKFDFESNRQSIEEHDFATTGNEAAQKHAKNAVDEHTSTKNPDTPDFDQDINLEPAFNARPQSKEQSDSEPEIDEFEQLMNLGSASELVHSQQQQNLIEQFSAQLETIEPELGVSDPTEPKSDSNSNDKQKPSPLVGKSPLTGKLEFELTSEERALVEQADLLHQLELENRIATLDEDAKEWSRHEPHLGEDLTASAASNRSPSFEPSHATTTQTNTDSDAQYAAEPVESTSDSQLPTEIDGDEETPKFVLQAEKKRRYGKWQTIALFFSCLLLVFATLLQGAYFFRTQIAAQWPATKPHLLRACQLIGCQIKLPAERRMLELVGSELLILNEELRINTLAFQIQNKSSTMQEWPALELTLKDRRGKTVLQKVFQASEYLNTKSDLPKGIAALSESNHKLYFELNIAKASNYQVEIFYP